MWTKPLVEAEALFIYSICISTQFSEYAGEAYYNLPAIYEVEFRLEFHNVFNLYLESFSKSLPYQPWFSQKADCRRVAVCVMKQNLGISNLLITTDNFL